MQAQELLSFIVNSLDENKGVDVKDIDVRPLTDVTDYIVICTATSSRHAKTLAEKLMRSLRDHDVRPLSTEGEQEDDWLLIDYVDVVVHIMLADTREFYSLEKLWTATEETRNKTTS